MLFHYIYGALKECIVLTILMRVALGTIFKFHIYFYILYNIIFTLREMREMFKFVKVATLALAFVAGMTR